MLESSDRTIFDLIEKEKLRQQDGMELIPSENYVSAAVLEAMGSVFTNKYSEGYPGKRYYAGNEVVDDLEREAQDRAKKLFGVPHANVQPYSGSPANLAIYLATCAPGDVIMGLNLPDGGHLTHGWKVSITGTHYKSVPYHVKPDGYLDLDEVRRLALEPKPKLMWCGATAYAREFPFEEFSKIADEVGAYFAADIAHIAGLVVAGVHKSPVPFAHIVTTTTHKTLRGPRGGMILVTEKGFKKDADLADKVDKAVFPGLQGGPHDHTTAAIAVALGEAAQPEFKTYGQQIVANAKALGEGLKAEGMKLVTDGTDNHLLLIDLTADGPGRGVFYQYALDAIGLSTNKNTIPNDPATPFYPSGLRIGTPAMTTRGLKEAEMGAIAKWIGAVNRELKDVQLPNTKEERIAKIKEFRAGLETNETIKKLREEVRTMARQFPVPGI